MDYLSLVSDKSIQDFSDRWGWDGGYQITGLILEIYPTKITKLKPVGREALVPDPHGSATARSFIRFDNSLNSTDQSMEGKGQVQKSIETGYLICILPCYEILITKTSAGCFVFTMFSCRHIYFWSRRIHFSK